MALPLLTALFAPTGLVPAAALLSAVLLTNDARAQALAPMVGASAIQGTLQGTSMPAYTGVLDRARTTVGGATGQPSNPPASGAGSGATNATKASSSFSGSGATVNGQPIPLCSHGGLCQGALMRAMGRP